MGDVRIAANRIRPVSRDFAEVADALTGLQQQIDYTKKGTATSLAAVEAAPEDDGVSINDVPVTY